MDAIDGGFKNLQESEYDFTANIQNAIALGRMDGVTDESMASYMMVQAMKLMIDTWEIDEDGE